MICAARAMAKALQVSIADQTSNVLGLDSAGEAPTASIQKSRIDIGNGDGIRVQNAQGFGWGVGWQPMVWTPRVAYVESDDEYGEDEDAEWQGRSPLYPAVAWDRRERRAHVTNLRLIQVQLRLGRDRDWAARSTAAEANGVTPRCPPAAVSSVRPR